MGFLLGNKGSSSKAQEAPPASSPPPSANPPTAADASAAAVAQAARIRAAAASGMGFADTIKTSAQGTTTGSTAGKTLLGA